MTLAAALAATLILLFAPAAVAAPLPAGTWWGVEDGRTTSNYKEYFPGYQFGCGGDQRHKGVDVGAPTGNRIYAWGAGRVVGRGYDPGGYNRWIQAYFPSVNMSLTLGHLLDGSELRVGTTFTKGTRWAKIGTRADGLNHSHVHFRAARGNHGASPIGPCEDMNPFILWDALGLPS
ncbi:M23 family metallopeptidase [Micromonospora sp. WMMD737]|uniref:M23 family metallopeptidase n=1 Tax=Micromonospora sp. WMMD737 TaxID=3404113 RepID=UPI003B93AC3C